MAVTGVSADGWNCLACECEYPYAARMYGQSAPFKKKKINEKKMPKNVDADQGPSLEDASNDSMAQKACDKADRVLIVDFP